MRLEQLSRYRLREGGNVVVVTSLRILPTTKKNCTFPVRGLCRVVTACLTFRTENETGRRVCYYRKLRRIGGLLHLSPVSVHLTLAAAVGC